MTQDEKINLLQTQLKECVEAFEEYISAVEDARRWYHDSTLWRYDGLDDRIFTAEQRLWNLKNQNK
jgi:hypothetical protein